MVNKIQKNPPSIHILGVCGTFMAGIAKIACELKLSVSGSDQAITPPMSDELAKLPLKISENYQQVISQQDVVLIGNIYSRGDATIEKLLKDHIPYQSAPNWLYEKVLKKRKVIAISGTHGKTTTTAMVSWILEFAGLNPGFLIGGVANNFSQSARLGGKEWFVIEADEYDTAFFDKRPKFLHYQPHILLINNLEFDHADIYKDLQAIQQQFHYLIRQIPPQGSIFYPANDSNVAKVIRQGCWSELIDLDKDWQIEYNQEESQVTITHQNNTYCETLAIQGKHNLKNSLSAIAIAHKVGVSIPVALQALTQFKGVKRRLEEKGQWNINNKTLRLIDDFAHHPTAIKYTIDTLASPQNNHKDLIVLLDCHSNTMKKGDHKHLLADSLKQADKILIWKHQELQWDIEKTLKELGQNIIFSEQTDELIKILMAEIQNNQTKDIDILVLSNGRFNNITSQIIRELNNFK